MYILNSFYELYLGIKRKKIKIYFLVMVKYIFIFIKVDFQNEKLGIIRNNSL